jgi:hypothetical protein
VFTEWVVIPVAPGAVTVAPGPGRRRGDSFLVDIGLMSPGPRVVPAELHRRIPSKVRGGPAPGFPPPETVLPGARPPAADGAVTGWEHGGPRRLCGT